MTIPPLKVPLFYLGFGACCFALALLGILIYPQNLTGFYYHPRVLAITHLVTLGWITGNILGTLYIVGPMSLQMYLNARFSDGVAFVLYAIGVSGMVAHFWRDRPVGMAWSAACVYAAILIIGVKVFRGIRTAKSPAFVKLHILFAFGNLFAAGAWGLLLAIHKMHGFLPTSSYPNVIAHAHLAAIGWATMMVFGIAYRLLPMFLPAAPPKGAVPWVSGLFLEVGILAFFFTTLMQSRLRYISAGCITIGILLFFVSAIRMVRNRKPAPPPEILRPDVSMLHAALGFIALAISIAGGFVLFRLPQTEKSLQWAFAYGALGLIGFLGQMVIGLKPKILSVFTWYHAFSRSGENVTRPVDMPVRILQIIVFALWLIGLPLLIGGLIQAASNLIRMGATCLLAGLIISTIHEYSILRITRAQKRQ